MRVSKFTVFLFVMIIGMSVFLAKLSNLVRINYDDSDNNYDGQHDQPLASSDTSFVIGDKPEPLLWFMQVVLLCVFICVCKY